MKAFVVAFLFFMSAGLSVAQEVPDQSEISAAELERASQPYIVKGIQTFQDDNAFVTEFTLDRTFEADNLEIDFINQTIQVNMPNAKIKDSRKKTISAQSDTVAKVVTFENGQNRVRSQIVLKRGQTAKQVENRVQIVKNKNTLQVRVLAGTASVTKSVAKAISVTKSEPAKSEPAKPEVANENIDELLQQAALKLTEEVSQAESSAEQKSEVKSEAKPEARSEENTPLTESAKVEAKSEAEIPVVMQAKAKADDKPFQRMLLALGVVGIVALGSLFFVRRYSRRNDTRVDSLKIKMLTQHHLGPKKSLAVIRVAGESILIGITDQNISMIKSLSLLDEEIPEELPGHFNAALGSSLRQVDEARFSIPVTATAYHDEEEEFAMGGLGEIKTLVSKRLKDMRSIE